MDVSIMTVLLLAATSWNFQLSPEEQAVRILDYGAKQPPTVIRVNTVGRYAAVLTRGGTMEGSPVDSPILFEHFSFGWQALEYLNFHCRLDLHITNAQDRAKLMRGMPAMQHESACGDSHDVTHDVGPSADVEAVRKLSGGPLVPSVAVSGNWAMGTWYGAGGGDQLYRRRDGEWRFVHAVGGEMGIDQMRRYHIPRSAWCAFGIHGANCHSSK